MKTLLSFLAFLAFLSCSCAKNETSSQALASSKYTLSELNAGEVSHKDLTITFDLSENRMYGYSGCNNFNGSFSLEKNTITFGPIASTKKFCMDNSSESELFKVLSGTKNYFIENNSIVLLDNGKELLKAHLGMNESNQQKNIIYEYRAMTRGSMLFIMVTSEDQSFTVSTAHGMKPSKRHYSQEDWEELESARKKIDLERFPTLEPPSKNHEVDGARAATLKIIVDGQEYETLTFDEGNPPTEISEIVKLLLSLAQKG